MDEALKHARIELEIAHAQYVLVSHKKSIDDSIEVEEYIDALEACMHRVEYMNDKRLISREYYND